MDLACGYFAKSQNNINRMQNGRIVLNSNTLMVVKLPDQRFLLVMCRSLFFAMIILSLPCIRSIIKGPSISYSSVVEYSSDHELINLEFLDLLLQDFCSEGLIKRGDKALIVSPIIDAFIGNSGVLIVNEIELVIESDLKRRDSLPHEEFDLVFVSGSADTKSVDRVVKTGGILAIRAGNEVSSAYQKQSNYGIVYLRRYGFTILAMRKTGAINETVDHSTNRRLCQLALETKKAALKGLEDVLLEPPRKVSAKSQNYLKKFRFLPDLLDDSLESYPRRILVNLDFPEKSSGTLQWFYQNYPTRNQDFEVYNLELVPKEESSRAVPRVDVSNWLAKNVKEEEYVVMKAEAEMVEEMIIKRVVFLVDELFLECKNQWQDGERKMKKSKRAYWECLALYGRLRDEGIAVHQWWD